MLRGEFESLKTIFSHMPDFVPEPIAQGTYASDPDIHFLLMRYVDMTNEIPEVDTLPEKLAELHRKAVSLNGKFGFHVPYSQSCRLQASGWYDSWETYFTNMYCEVFEWEKEMHGENEEMQALFEQIVEKVIPRLLRPLETGGNTIQPRFVHGDLWDGNASTDAITENPVIFDGTSFYGHSECKLNKQRPPVTNLIGFSRPWCLESPTPPYLSNVY